MIQQLAYTIARNGNITVYVNFNPYHVNAEAPNYEKVMEILKSDTATKIDDLLVALDVRAALTSHLSNYITIVDNELYYKDTVINTTLADRIVEFFHKGYAISNLIKFFERLQANPSERAQIELFNFLEKNDLHITDDGYFLAYKKVRSNYTDLRTGTFDNSVGATPWMDRNDDNADEDCSHGLHVGTYKFAYGFSNNYDNKLILVKVDPTDCVSVPKSDAGKMRVCQYLVIADVTGKDGVTPAFVAESTVTQLAPTPTPVVATEKKLYRDKQGHFISKEKYDALHVVTNQFPNGVTLTTNKLPQRDSKGRFLPK